MDEKDRQKLLDLLREYRWAFHEYMKNTDNDTEDNYANLDDMNEAQNKIIEMFKNK